MKKIYTFMTVLLALSSSAQDFQFGWLSSAGSGNNETASAMATDSNGNLYAAGTFSGNIDFDFNDLEGVPNETSAFMVKHSNDGTVLWAKSINGSQNGFPFIYAMSTFENNLYITGEFYGTVDFDPSAAISNLVSNNSSGDFFLAKYNAQGGFLWAKNFGGPNNDDAKAMAIDQNGNLYITGLFRGTVDFDPSTTVANLSSVGDYDSFLASFDAEGNYRWAHHFGGENTLVSNDLALSDNGVFIAGQINDTADFDPSAEVAILNIPNNGAFLAKYSFTGAFNWVRGSQCVGFSGQHYANSIDTDASGNVFITGFLDDSIQFEGTSIVLEPAFEGSRDSYLAKYTATGDLAWTKSWGSDDSDFAVKTAVNDLGQVAVTGRFSGTMQIDPSDETRTAQGDEDIYIGVFDTNGTFLSTLILGGEDDPSKGSSDDEPTDILYSGNNLYVCGSYVGTVDFNPDPFGSIVPAAEGGSDIFIGKYATSFLGIRDYVLSGIKIYPNPSNSIINVSNSTETPIDAIVIYDLLGKVVWTTNANQFNIEKLAKGVYILKAVSGSKSFQKKIIKE